jgi:HEAT repeat protein
MHRTATLLLFLLALPVAAQESTPTQADRRAVRAAQRKAAAERESPEPAEGEAEAPEFTYASLQTVTEFSELVARDKRVTFGARTHPAALREFERLVTSDSGKAAALMALGCARIATERVRLESFAREGATELRQAAILALGELKSSDLSLLLELAGKRAALAEYALFALARNGSAAARQAVAEVAEQEAHPLNGAARDALGFGLEPPVDSPVARRYYDLRFEAGRRFGLVDEQAWTTLLVDDLSRNQKFLSRVIYRAASELTRPGVKDHFIEVALAGGAPERLRGVVRAMPTELSRLLEEDLFRPLDSREWLALIEEIDRRNLEVVCVPLLRRAWTDPAARVRAMSLLARAKAEGAVELVDLALRSGAPEVRAAAAQALAYVPNEKALALLATAERDPEASVRAAVLVAQYRLGSETASNTLRETLQIDETQQILAQLRESSTPARGAGAGRGAKGGGARGAKPDAPKEGEAGGDPSAARAQRQEQAAKASARLTPLPRAALELVEALLPACSDRRVRDLLAVVRARTPDGLRLRVDSELSYHGDARARAALREALQTRRPAGATGARAVEALGRGPGLADLELLRELFPLGDDPDVDVELALELVRARDASVLAILRAALWSEPWNRSVLAGALLVSHGGLEALRSELQRPPAGVSERDLRRVGFALGEWGGTAEVDRLAGRVGAADPALQGALLGALAARTR